MIIVDTRVVTRLSPTACRTCGSAKLAIRRCGEMRRNNASKGMIRKPSIGRLNARHKAFNRGRGVGDGGEPATVGVAISLHPDKTVTRQDILASWGKHKIY